MKKSIFLFSLTALFLLCGCKKEKLTCTITSPVDGATISIDKDLVVTVEATSSTSTVAVVTVYLDNLPYTGSITSPYTATIPALLLTAGTRTIKAVAVNREGVQAEHVITVTFTEDGGGEEDESPNFVTFTNGKIPSSWKTNTWVIDVAMGFDDNHSLRSDNPVSSVLTNKTMNVSGYVEFYIRSDYGDFFDLFIDGTKATAASITAAGNSWKKCVYSFSKGKHSFRWENTMNATIHLDHITFAASSLPEVTTGEITDISSRTAIASGTVVNHGNSFTTRGICWSTSQNPTVNDNKTVEGNGMGTFESNITNLQPKTLYYVRAYATNDIGTVYGVQKSFTTESFQVGDYHQGGIIFYVDDTGNHGLIAATSDQGQNVQWYNGNFINTGATGTDIGTGKSNTAKIIQAQGNGNYAAKICDNLIIESYSDWFLPSQEEMRKVCENKNVVGNIQYWAYWSSSEYSFYIPWAVYIPTDECQPTVDKKEYKYGVRCIREF